MQRVQRMHRHIEGLRCVMCCVERVNFPKAMTLSLLTFPLFQWLGGQALWLLVPGKMFFGRICWNTYRAVFFFLAAGKYVCC